jgi:hypothetical protein
LCQIVPASIGEPGAMLARSISLIAHEIEAPPVRAGGLFATAIATGLVSIKQNKTI